MVRGLFRALWPAVGWAALPLVPALLAATSYKAANFMEHDPREWGIVEFVVLLGPLVGYGFLAGATAVVPDEQAGRGLKAWLRRRSFWVGVGPWAGFLVCVAGYFAYELILKRVPLPELLSGNGYASKAFIIAVLAIYGYGWLVIAWIALRRAKRQRRLGLAFRRGVAVAFGFVGSLIGTFWGITSGWRAFFFDTTVVRALLVGALTVTMLSGCASVTAGDLRRRELFDALMLAWVIGLALGWRWLSRRRDRTG